MLTAYICIHSLAHKKNRISIAIVISWWRKCRHLRRIELLFTGS